MLHNKHCQRLFLSPQKIKLANNPGDKWFDKSMYELIFVGGNIERKGVKYPVG